MTSRRSSPRAVAISSARAASSASTSTFSGDTRGGYQVQSTHGRGMPTWVGAESAEDAQPDVPPRPGDRPAGI